MADPAAGTDTFASRVEAGTNFLNAAVDGITRLRGDDTDQRIESASLFSLDRKSDLGAGLGTFLMIAGGLVIAIVIIRAIRK